MAEIIRQLLAKKGHSYFGSGGYSAGWKVLDGKVEATLIAGTEDDNGFRRVAEYILRPTTSTATVEVWVGDSISSAGWRSLGREGTVTLTQ